MPKIAKWGNGVSFERDRERENGPISVRFGSRDRNIDPILVCLFLVISIRLTGAPMEHLNYVSHLF